MRKCVFVTALLVALNAQAEWITMNDEASVSLNGIYMLDSQAGWVVGDGGTVYHLTANGSQWEAESGLPGSEDFNDVYFVSPTAGWCVGTSGSVSDGRVYKRDPDGTWAKLSPPSTPELLALCCIGGSTENSHRVWVAGFSRTILHSSNSGSAWHEQTSLAGSAYRDVTFVDQSRGWIVGNSGVIVRTADGGFSWSPQLPSQTSAWLYGVYFADRYHGWAVGAAGTIVATNDGGDSWFSQTCPTISRLNAVVGIDTLNLIAVGDAGTVIRTSDGGGTWVEEGGLAGDLYDVAMTDTMNYWIVGANGANFYSLGSIEFTGPVPDTLFAGDAYDIRFSARFIDRVDLSFQSAPGDTWITIEEDYPVTGSPRPWTVPELNSEEASLRISSAVPGKDLSDEMTFAVFIDDRDAPVISNPQLPPQPMKDNDLTVSATIEDLHGVSATLWYRLGGFDAYIPAAMTMNPTDPTRFESVIGGSNVTLNGLYYYIEAVDSSYFANRGFYRSALNPAYVRIHTDNEDFSIPPSQPGSEVYQMISIPLVLDSKDISEVLERGDVLGPYDKTKWRLFRWSPTANQGLGQYLEYRDLLSETTFEPSRAFWLVSSTGGLKTGSGHSAPPADGVIDIADSGWHQVANPFDYDVTVGSIDLDPLLSGFYYWDPDAGEYDLLGSGDVLRPYEGYFILADADYLSIIIPPFGGSSIVRTVEVSHQSLDWQIVLCVRSEGKRDSRLLFGQSSGADDHFDRLDRLDVPPPCHRSVNSYIPHPDWPTFKGNYRADVRSPAEDGTYWDFNVESDVNGPILMTFELAPRIPSERQVFLIPRDDGFPEDLRENSLFQYLNSDGGGARSFRLVVGSQEFMNEHLSLLQPTQIMLSQNHPNPFSGSTSIRYALPNPGEVTICIYNVRGQEIAVVLDEEPMEAGYHVEVWDGKSKYGHDVSGGVYFYQLRVGASRNTKKMVLIE